MSKAADTGLPFISRRAFMKLSGAGALGFGMGVSMGKTAKAAGRPNILMIITDQQHFDTISALGCRYVDTPAMDSLVTTGASFQLSYCTNPLCSPARSSIFTGRTPSETGVYVNGEAIRSTIPNLGQWLGGKAGYEAVYAGKWHVPASYTRSVPGFRVIHTGIGGQGNLCDTAVSLACEGFLRNRRSRKPFLMVASFLQPHDICEWLRLNIRVPDTTLRSSSLRSTRGSLRYPELAGDLPPLPENHAFDPAEPEMVRRIRKGCEPARGNWTEEHWRYYLWSYYRHIEQVDGEIGRVLQALGDTGLDDDTLILFTSDHGEGLARHGTVRKSMPYDEAMKVPMVLSFPGRIPAGRADAEHLVSGLDIVPTLCDYAGVEPPENVRGSSMMPLMEKRVTEDRREDPHRFIVAELNSDRGRLVRTPRYKYVAYRADRVEQLFDMRDDPGETKNLAGSPEYNEVLAEHRRMLKDWESGLEVAPNVPKSAAWWRP